MYGIGKGIISLVIGEGRLTVLGGGFLVGCDARKAAGMIREVTKLAVGKGTGCCERRLAVLGRGIFCLMRKGDIVWRKGRLAACQGTGVLRV